MLGEGSSADPARELALDRHGECRSIDDARLVAGLLGLFRQTGEVGRGARRLATSGVGLGEPLEGAGIVGVDAQGALKGRLCACEVTQGLRRAPQVVDVQGHFGMVGPEGSTPREWRLTFWNRRAAREALHKALSWDPQRLIIAHGECAPTGATDIIADALRWI